MLLALLAVWLVLVVAHFPYDTDAPLSEAEAEKNRLYYAEAYKQISTGQNGTSEATSTYEAKYLEMAKAVAEGQDIRGKVERFVKDYGLKDRAMLEIGSGRGYLQDVLPDYTGLDISSNVARFYHKKFVLGSATALPFEDNTFDGGWSIWVFEHVPNPEQALRECRRVMKDGAIFFLNPALNSTSWAADGYEVRPYSDFGVGGKLIKASVSVRATRPFRFAMLAPIRIVRSAMSLFENPTKLRYHRLAANYKEYWQPDSDAINGMDRQELMLWFQSRGDECLNCAGLAGSPIMRADPLIIKIHKQAATAKN